MDKEQFADHILDLARKCIDWHAARAAGGVTVSSETSGLTLGTAMAIRASAIAAGLWLELTDGEADTLTRVMGDPTGGGR